LILQKQYGNQNVVNKPYSQACENNKAPILAVIREIFSEPTTVWEIGSGTGQHACYFASELPHLIWQATDVVGNLPGINAWREEVQLTNLNLPIALDVTDSVWPCNGLDAVFTANTLHIMSWQQVEMLFERFQTYLNLSARVCIYGPFNYNGKYTSDSNANFDQWLKSRDPLSGIRDFEAVMVLAESAGLRLLSDNPMPANNRLLVFNMTYTIAKNRLDFAIWAAYRAAQAGSAKGTGPELSKALKISGVITYIDSYTGILVTDLEFNTLHKKWCHLIMNTLKHECNKEISYGRSAKLLNVFLKGYFILANNEQTPLGMVVHPPIDSKLIESMDKAKKTKYHNKYKWQKLNEHEYFEILGILKSMIEPNDPLWKIEQYWSLS
jgi:Protein of unknown function (DUF938)